MPLQQFYSNSISSSQHLTLANAFRVSVPTSKKTCKPFPPSESKADAKLERTHSDICGQFPDSEGNTVYNLVFIDEFTRWAVGTLCRSQRQTFCYPQGRIHGIHCRSRTTNWHENQETTPRWRRRIQGSTHSNSEVPRHQIRHHRHLSVMGRQNA